jgi:hypothetical protein
MNAGLVIGGVVVGLGMIVGIYRQKQRDVKIEGK